MAAASGATVDGDRNRACFFPNAWPQAGWRLNSTVAQSLPMRNEPDEGSEADMSIIGGWSRVSIRRLIRVRAIRPASLRARREDSLRRRDTGLETYSSSAENGRVSRLR